MDNIIFEGMYKLENHHWWFVARRKIISVVIAKLGLPTNCNILDVGCGNGANLALLSKFGDVVAIEKDVKAIERAKSRKIGKVYQADLPDNIPDNIGSNFDLIVKLDVLEHIDSDQESLISIKKMLGEKGKLLITVPAYQWLWSKHDVLHHHKRRYTQSEVKQLLHHCGFKIHYISYFNTLLFPFAVIERIQQKLFPTKEEDVLKMPYFWLNYILEKIFSLEVYLIKITSLPFGLSIIAVAEKSNS